MELYKKWSGKLTVQAASDLLHSTGTPASAITHLITVSCTGFSAPNFDYDLIMSLDLPRQIRRTHIGFMGCAAALVGLSCALDALQSARDRDATILLVAIELCSLHLQTEPTRDNILANMIFADGCGAALLASDSARPANARLVDTHSLLFPDSRNYMGWEIGNHGFEMLLSSELPDAVASQAVPAAKEIIRRMGLKPEDIRFWALHPGGRAIIDALQHGLSLTDDQVAPSRTVLKQHGNMSSASILFVLKEIFSLGRLQPDDWLCAIAFGPGLTMEMAFLRGV
jgi:predicted naringenin-chalcone synthase